jgi:hypothetical protein
LYKYVPHPHILRRHQLTPAKVQDQHTTGNAMERFNTKAALLITKIVGSMWCAYAFAAFDMISLPDAIRSGTAQVVSWIAQTFLQLVLLSVIMVGQNVQAQAADARSEQTFNDAEAILHSALSIQDHLEAQDGELQRQTQALTALLAKYVPDAGGTA